MNIHSRARSTPLSRAELVSRVQHGERPRTVAALYAVSARGQPTNGWLGFGPRAMPAWSTAYPSRDGCPGVRLRIARP